MFWVKKSKESNVSKLSNHFSNERFVYIHTTNPNPWHAIFMIKLPFLKYIDVAAIIAAKIFQTL